MKNKLIPIYREQEIYTLFYDTVHEKLVLFPHRKNAPLAYVYLIILVLLGSWYFNDIYQPYKDPLFNIILFLVVIVFSYVFAKIFMNSYYIQRTEETVYLDNESMENCAIQGMKQLRMELYLGGGISVLFTVAGFALFFIFSQLVLLTFGGLGVVAIFLILLTRPFTRIKVLKKFQSKEIRL
ncbi:hypothetical protein [Virgibacillus necropolis]|uniref:Uncharacterized protein n=1 Tax=Virgibacillus necropolis TaxID=163877 RepID=A0A221MCL3_9BACI|nr:hypothetical protein [Virgibacillus necropolis]ASN05374.1 hypothetical protein CFK40_10290 [Virgibacillus necropolis]